MRYDSAESAVVAAIDQAVWVKVDRVKIDRLLLAHTAWLRPDFQALNISKRAVRVLSGTS